MKTRPLLRELWRLLLVIALLLAACFGLMAQITTSEPADLSGPASREKQNPTKFAQREASSVYKSPWIDEIVRLAQAGIDETVILAYVDTAGTFNLGSDQIIALRQKGVSDPVISAILLHDAAYLNGSLQNAPAPPSSPSLLFQATRSGQSSSPPRTEEPPAPLPAEEFTTIVHPSPAEELEEFVLPLDLNLGFKRRFDQITPVANHIQPVRLPYAVQLTDTIYVYRAVWRMPNIQILQSLP